jgi:hypothetical protein
MSKTLALTLVMAMVSIFVYVGCSDDMIPTGPSPVAKEQTSSSNSSDLSIGAGFAETADEEFNCKNVGRSYVRFSAPGWIQGNKVGMWIKHENMPEGQKKLRIWWDYKGAPDTHRDIDISDVTYFEQVIEHEYMNLNGKSEFCVRVELILQDSTGNCARNRWINIAPKTTLTAGPPCGGDGSCTVFQSSSYHNGNMGGIGGADAICQSLANSAGLTGTFKAWLSNSTSSPATRFTHATVPYVLVTGTQIAANWADLVDGTIGAAIDRTENGTLSAGIHVWTSTLADGTADGTTQCNDWTATTGPLSTKGSSLSTTATWTAMAFLFSCSNTQPIYCFEQ